MSRIFNNPNLNSTDRIYSEQVVINSINRESTSTLTNAIFNLSKVYRNVKAVRFNHFSIPNTFSNVTSSNNSIQYVDNTGTHNITLTVGHYDITDLLAQLKSKMDTASAPTTYTVAVSSITNKITFTPSVGTLAFNFATQPASAKLLGFAQTNQVAGASQTGAYIYSLINPDHLLIKMLPLTAKINYNGVGAHLCVPVDTAWGDLIIWNEGSYWVTEIDLLVPTDIRQLSVQIIDQSNTEVNTNGQDDWMMVLDFISV